MTEVGLAVDAFPAALLVAEVLDRVGHVQLAPIDAGGVQGLVQELAGRSDERFAGSIFLITGLLADQHEAGGAGAAGEDNLGGVLPQFASPAIRGLEGLDVPRFSGPAVLKRRKILDFRPRCKGIRQGMSKIRRTDQYDAEAVSR